MCNQRHVTNGLLLTNKWFKWRDFLPILLASLLLLSLSLPAVVAFKFEFGNLNRIRVLCHKCQSQSQSQIDFGEDDRKIHAISRMRFSRVVVVCLSLSPSLGN